MALTRGKRESAATFCPSSVLVPVRRLNNAGKPCCSVTWWQILVTAMDVRGVISEGFHTILLPHTAAIMAFHDQTAAGKLKAVITAMFPSGCHCSYIRCFGRSECMVLP